MKHKTLLSVALAALVSLTPGFVLAAGKRKYTPPPIHETKITSVSATSITISEDKNTKTLTINQFTEITLNGAKATAADLKPGMRVSITMRDATTLSRIAATQ